MVASNGRCIGSLERGSSVPLEILESLLPLKWCADAPTATCRTCLCKQSTKARATRRACCCVRPGWEVSRPTGCMHTGPNSVDFGTVRDQTIEDSKRHVFSTAEPDWNRGFWHSRLDRGQNRIRAGSNFQFAYHSGGTHMLRDVGAVNERCEFQ